MAIPKRHLPETGNSRRRQQSGRIPLIECFSKPQGRCTLSSTIRTAREVKRAVAMDQWLQRLPSHQALANLGPPG